MAHPVGCVHDLSRKKLHPQYLQGCQTLVSIAWNHCDVVTMIHTSPIPDFGHFLQVFTPYKWKCRVPLRMDCLPGTAQRGLTRYKKVSCAISGQLRDTVGS